jgi:hypothetical protein
MGGCRDCRHWGERASIETPPLSCRTPEAWRDAYARCNHNAMTKLKSTEIATALSAAMAERRLVKLVTRYDEWAVHGYVAGLGPGFVLISVVNDRIWLDGFECFRRPDIIAIEDAPYAAFIEAALARRGEIIPDAPPVSLASIEDLLRTAGRAFRLITIHREEVDPGVCHIGNLCEVLDGHLVMREVTPAAEWEAEFERYPTVDITRVSFGADYEEALSLVAGAPSPI